MTGRSAFYSSRPKYVFWRFTNPIFLFAGTLVVVMGGGALAMTSPGLDDALSLIFRIVAATVMFAAVLLPLIAVVDCIGSDLPMNTKLLWILINLAAPIIGSLLWFFWGRFAHRSDLPDTPVSEQSRQ